MTRFRSQTLVAYGLTLGLLSWTGCSDGSSLVEVRGRVMEGTTPVAGASVTYQPIAKSADDIAPGPSSFGITDAEGRYDLRTIKEDSVGAVIGSHHVYISLDKGDTQDGTSPQPKPAADRIPKKFSDGTTVVEIPPAGAADVDFDIAS
ncbi:hypothetical protein [Lacipirellula sp.]|uniref:hypothetical protein n=1 Tax=Lacipirellula sp. TaxID=2691419 RepID=UPI003D0F045C